MSLWSATQRQVHRMLSMTRTRKSSRQVSHGLNIAAVCILYQERGDLFFSLSGVFLSVPPQCCSGVGAGLVVERPRYESPTRQKNICTCGSK